MTRGSCVFLLSATKKPRDYNSSHYSFLYKREISDGWCWIEILLHAGVYFVLTSHLMKLHLQALRLSHSCSCLTYRLPCPFCLCAASCRVCIPAYICAKQLYWMFGPSCIESQGPVFKVQPGQSNSKGVVYPPPEHKKIQRLHEEGILTQKH